MIQENPMQDKYWPNLVNEHEAIERYSHPDGNYRLYIVRRADSTYSTFEEELSEYQGRMRWHPIGLGPSLYESKESLFNELLVHNDWLHEAIAEKNT